MTRRTLALIVALVMVVAGCSSTADTTPPPGSTGSDRATTPPTASTTTATSVPLAGSRHNVMVVLVDDATYEEIRVMQHVQKLAAEGTSFSRFYTTTPNCCPSRGGFYLGQYPHNTGIRDNIPPLGGANSFVPHANESIGVWMQRAGYYTAQIGKYLNGWGNAAKPDEWQGGITPEPGWDHWFVDIDPTTYQYYDYKISNDGNEQTYGHTPAEYQTDVTGAEAVKTIKTAAATKKPWFITWSPMSPHIAGKESANGPNEHITSLAPVPADTYKGRFANEPLPKTPSMVYGPDGVNTPDLQGKPAYIRTRVSEIPANERTMTEAYRAELEALQSVDDWVGTIYQTLHDLGQLDSTEIVFWSDNGLFHGEHDLIQKGLLYEEAAHIPLVVRGPGFPAGKVADQLTLNIDLTPTILSIAGAKAPSPLDGRNLTAVAEDPKAAADRAILLEYWYSFTHMTTTAVRYQNWVLMVWSTGELELYDLASDPYEMHNLATDPARNPQLSKLRSKLTALEHCTGASCEDSDASRG